MLTPQNLYTSVLSTVRNLHAASSILFSYNLTNARGRPNDYYILAASHFALTLKTAPRGAEKKARARGKKSSKPKEKIKCI